MNLVSRLGHKLLLRLDAEKAHEIGLEFMSKGIFAPKRFSTADSKINFLGVELDNPLGLAAGFDKNGVIEDVRNYGFSFAEIGSVTYRGGKGNPKPRLFRFKPQRSLGNRMGLNGRPAEEVASGLSYITSPYGINIAKTHDPKIMGDEAIEDIVNAYEILKDFGFYHVINISCPNTSEGKTFEDNPATLKRLLSEISQLGKTKPLLVKLSPTLHGDKLSEIVKTAEPFVEGYVCGNTLPSGHDSIKWTSEMHGKMGVSGALLKPYSLSLIRNVRSLSNKPIIGVGGIYTGRDAFDALNAGANVLQAYTGFIYRGTDFAHLVNKELAQIKIRESRK